MGECLLGSKWNPQKLRCDDPKNIATPCKISLRKFFLFIFIIILGGLRTNNGISLSHQYLSTIAMIFFFINIRTDCFML